ncbi:hypothetical protein O2W14_03140 [Modestobacter sp. VKM Ac-2986]|uniref:hypothetical protein n=1 Tax=Modestobacter sp. VKM Ac-2986 TaxID=3004140 RepID=UPI0022AB1639|nr:hypothetical protein [Modestobacter sp. VKM Ac-2986]MCZ2827829.1 hypothetical protein [Modestobacter sp. VKM Ac-2986]
MTNTSPTGQRTRRPLREAALAVLTGLLAVLAPLAAATPASASGYYGYDGGYSGDTNGQYTGPVVVFPMVNCIQVSNGTYSAVLGYRNTSTSTYSITGGYNVISPSSYNGRQPTTFRPGTYSGVFTVPVTSGTVYWTLGNTKLTINRTAAKTCGADTQMPADGNGTGVVGALAVAAGAGALVVQRTRRRLAGTPSEETVDA